MQNLQRLRTFKSSIWRSVGMPVLKKRASNSWSAVQDTYFSTKDTFERHKVVFTVGTSIASVGTAWLGYTIRHLHDTRVDRRLDSIEQAMKSTYQFEREEIKKIAGSGNYSTAACAATAGTTLIIGGRASLQFDLVALPRKISTSYLFKRFLSTNNTCDLASSIAEFNKEQEDIFGEPPSSSGPLGSSGSGCVTQDNQFSSPEVSEKVCGLTHIGKQGEAKMVDVSPKENTKRTAVASCKVVLEKKVFDLVSENQLAKGDVLNVAKIAGITGAKQTSNLIPLCHNIILSHVDVDLALNPLDYSVDIKGEASTTGKTGVEMEAMTAVSIAGLTVYDMCKAASKNIVISNVRLEYKTGGKSGDWSREE